MKIKINILLVMSISMCILDRINAAQIDSSEIFQIINSTYLSEQGPQPTFEDVYLDVKRIYNNMDENIFEDYFIACAMNLYDTVMVDTTNYKAGETRTLRLMLRSFDLSKRYDRNVERLLYVLFQSKYTPLMEMSVGLLAKYSKDWFIFSNNTIDDISLKKYYDFRIFFYRVLLARTMNDSLEYTLFHALQKEGWYKIVDIDTALANRIPEYRHSKQRLEILSKLEDDHVKEYLKLRRKILRHDKNSDSYKEWEDEYNTYLQLKAAKDLGDYFPPNIR